MMDTLQLYTIQFILQFSHSVVSNSLQPHEPQHARPPLKKKKKLNLKFPAPNLADYPKSKL